MFNEIYVVLVIVIAAVMASWFAFSPTYKVAVEDRVPSASVTATINEDVKVAIIGSGIGGASAAYFIRKHVGPHAEIHVYEKSTKVGGRLAIKEFKGHWYEAGGSIIHSSNQYMVNFIKELGLEERGTMNDGSTFGIYDGKEFVFLESANSIITKLKMVWRYGPFSLWHLQRSLSKMFQTFHSVYQVQDKERAFGSVSDLLRSMGGEDFYSYTQQTSEEMMLANGIGDLLIQELVTAVTRNNYGQDSHVNAFTGYVSMAGAQGGSLFSVKGGNYLVPKLLLQHSNATLFTDHHISSIRKDIISGKIVYFLNDDSADQVGKQTENGETMFTLGDNNHDYDAVIVAAPLEVPECYIKCLKCTSWPDQSISKMYQQTIATFVQGYINYNYFGVGENQSPPDDIFTTENEKILFSSIGRQTDVTGAQAQTPHVYKVFSREKLKDETIKRMFKIDSSQGGNHSESVRWLAYPHYTPPESFAPFRLDTGVFYVNAIERVASAMEMSAIGGRNAALLTKKYLLDRNK